MKPDPIVIRELRTGDAIPPLTALLHTAYAPLARMGFRFLATHQDDATTLRRAREGVTFIAEHGAEPAGILTLRPPQTRSLCEWFNRPGVWTFGQFAVSPRIQGRGLGRRLLRTAEEHALRNGAAHLALDTAEGAAHLITWYERLGFRFVQHVRWEVTNYRSVVMSKPLNAWLRIPLADYEAHMALPQVAQARMLAEQLARFAEEMRPHSLTVAGVAGGNGLESLSPGITRRVVAIDVNRDYLAACEKRHAGRFEQFEAVEHDLSLGMPATPPVDALFAGLVLEYVNVKTFCASLAAALKPGGHFAAVLQLPSPDLPEVSETPYTSLQALAATFHPVPPHELDALLVAEGFVLVKSEETCLPSGKTFHFGRWRRK